MKICTKCIENKEIKHFNKDNGKKDKLHNWCRACCKEKNDQRKDLINDNDTELARKASTKAKYLTRISALPHIRCYVNCKNNDKKKNRENDLTKEFVEEEFKKPCYYCGDNKLNRNLDRIDNSKGHTKSNVNSCCSRCNSIRKDLPYEVWMRIVPSIRQCVEEGMLEGYIAHWEIASNKNKTPEGLTFRGF